MTNEWMEWAGDGRIRTPLRGSSCNSNFINNNNYATSKFSEMGLKVHSVMKSLQRPKGITILNTQFNF